MPTPAEIQKLRHPPGSLKEHDQIMDRFRYHVPTDDQRDRLENFGQNLMILVDLFLFLCPEPTRERSIALTVLEEARMRCNQSIVFSDPPVKHNEQQGGN
jgi:hypothetical protein